MKVHTWERIDTFAHEHRWTRPFRWIICDRYDAKLGASWAERRTTGIAITQEIEENPGEADRLRESMRQAREGQIRWFDEDQGSEW